jgi:uncharacterized membrane protein HdeD (DUF308 family)
MKNGRLLSSVLQLCVGLAAIIVYIIVEDRNELLVKWTVTLFLAVTFIIRGAIGIATWIKSKKQA